MEHGSGAGVARLAVQDVAEAEPRPPVGAASGLPDTGTCHERPAARAVTRAAPTVSEAAGARATYQVPARS